MKYAFVFLLFVTGCAPVFQPKVFAYDKHISDVASLSNGKMAVATNISDQCTGLGSAVKKAAIENGSTYIGTFEGGFSGNSLETIEYLNYAIPKFTPIIQNSIPQFSSWKSLEFGYSRGYPLQFQDGIGLLWVYIIDQSYSKIPGSKICFSYSFR